MLQGGAHGLASEVRVRLPSASSAPLKRAQSAEPSAHPALESPQRARESLLFRTCSSSTDSILETAFSHRSGLHGSIAPRDVSD
eukprot:5364019-Prymnesium_polylepis.2